MIMIIIIITFNKNTDYTKEGVSLNATDFNRNFLASTEIFLTKCAIRRELLCKLFV